MPTLPGRKTAREGARAVRKGVRAAAAHVRRHGRTHAILVTVAFGLFWVPVIIFVAIAGEVHEREPIPFDVATLDRLYTLHTPVLDRMFLFITSLGNPLSVVGIGLAIVGLLTLAGRYRSAGALVAGVGGAALANVLLKLVFARVRPNVFPTLIPESGYSFPSGHAMVSSAFAFTLIFIAWHTRWRIPVTIVALIATILIGISRLYVGVHYPSDVVAGWAVGSVWAALACSLVINFPFKLHIHISRLLTKRA